MWQKLGIQHSLSKHFLKSFYISQHTTGELRANCNFDLIFNEITIVWHRLSYFDLQTTLTLQARFRVEVNFSVFTNIH